ncbi:hypothetical protein OG474_20645 [Kribbella sp. NBC_01505]|uniref:hypothetical protein n=1 Tax=Kribbella sp. NBC_01505 TaxID=2903580 RepID=UPI0038658862
MGVVERAEVVRAHAEVVGAWREIVEQASDMGLADRIAIGVTLRARAEALAGFEGLARDAGDLATDARAFAAAVRAQNPLSGVMAGVGLAAGVLGFFGWWSFQALRTVFAPAAEVGMAQTTAALIGVVTVASGAVIVSVVRAALEAARAALESLESLGARSHPSAVLLREVRPAEERLFAVFRQQVPEPPISAGPLIVIGTVGVLAGAVCAALAGVGVAAG